MNKLLLTVAALSAAIWMAGSVSAYALTGNASTQATAVRTGFVEIDPERAASGRALRNRLAVRKLIDRESLRQRRDQAVQNYRTEPERDRNHSPSRRSGNGYGPGRTKCRPVRPIKENPRPDRREKPDGRPAKPDRLPKACLRTGLFFIRLLLSLQAKNITKRIR